MAIYECCFRDRMGHVAWRTNITASDDAEARNIVDQMSITMFQPDLIELWLGRNLIHTSQRGSQSETS